MGLPCPQKMAEPKIRITAASGGTDRSPRTSSPANDRATKRGLPFGAGGLRIGAHTDNERKAADELCQTL